VLITAWFAVCVSIFAAIGHLYAEGYLSHLGIEHDQLVRPTQAYVFKVLYLINFVFEELSLSQGDLLRWIGMSFAVILGGAVIITVLDMCYDWLKVKWLASKRPGITLSEKMLRRLGVFGTASGIAMLIAYAPIMVVLLLANIVAPAELGAAAARSNVTKFIEDGGCTKKIVAKRVVARCARLVNAGENGVETELMRGTTLAASEKFVVFLAEFDRSTPNESGKKTYEVRLIQMKDTMSLRRDVLVPPLQKSP
jgi:hypothetical protein